MTYLASKLALGKVSLTADGWTANHTKVSFLGVMAHWIDIKDGAWVMCGEVIGFQGASGSHSGYNLGRYFVGLIDHVGITGPNNSKVNNICKIILLVLMILSDLHNHT
jgi:hypothetical protein